MATVPSKTPGMGPALRASATALWGAGTGAEDQHGQPPAAHPAQADHLHIRQESPVKLPTQTQLHHDPGQTDKTEGETFCLVTDSKPSAAAHNPQITPGRPGQGPALPGQM
jgi:hypothetical protein